MTKVVLIDGNSLVNRAFYAVPPLTNKEGFQTNAIYGFCNMLNRIIKDEAPSYLLVAFDAGREVFRHQMYEGYKARRKATPEELRAQFPVLKTLLQAMGVAQMELPGYEADDIIGTYATRASQEGLDVVIITGDRDSFQLIDERTTVLMTRKGITELERFDLDHLHEVYQLSPSQIVDLKGLMGDASDDIPGVPGIGEKTALKLLADHETLEGVLAARGAYAGKKLGERLETYQEQAILSKQLATIDRAVPAESPVKTFVLGPGDPQEKIRLFQELEFKALLQEAVKEEREPEAVEAPPSEAARKLKDWTDLAAYFQDINQAPIYLAAQGQHQKDGRFTMTALGMKVAGREGVFLNLEEWSEENLVETLAPYLAKDQVLVTVDAKALFMQLEGWGIHRKEEVEDLLLMSYLLDPARPYARLTGLELLQEQGGKKSKKNQEEVFWTSQQWGELLALMAQLHPRLEKALRQENLWTLYEKGERPLAPILARMEKRGVKVEPAILQSIGAHLDQKIASTSEAIFAITGEVFNLNSPKQLGDILFGKLALAKGKKTKTGYSTDAETLEYLAQDHEIARMIIEYRQYAKLKSTYIEGLLGILDPKTNKVHTSLNQTIAVTGRLSSTEPNLQNIPVRLEEGRQIRKAFVASPGCQLLAGDYSQIELRILAHLSGDVVLQEAFLEGQDIHRRTASEVFAVPLSEVTSQQRRAAKAVNFGLIYGISDFGLAQDLGISRGEAKEYMERYFMRYPRVKAYLDEILITAAEKGFVETLMHRRRYLPELSSRNYHTRSFGQRAAMNAPIQGTAADIMKLAMVEVQKILTQHGLEDAMVLQVHDELIFDLPMDKINEVKEAIRGAMEQVMTLAVPLKVDLKQGLDWYHMEPVQSGR